LDVTFTAETSSDIDHQSAGIDNLKLTANYSCDRRQLDSCDSVEEVANENFESGLSDGWSDGLVAYDSSVGHFLGRMGKENPLSSKTFNIPADADKVTVSFKLYEFGTWGASDKFSVKVGSADLDLGAISLETEKSGSVSGISWSRRRFDGVVKSHQVSITVPSASFLSGRLNLNFVFNLSDFISRKSGGIDDLVINAHGLCEGGAKDTATHFGMAAFSAGEPSLDGNDEDEGPYCRAEDYPCNGGDMVYVCHYSVFKGYSSYCVKEADTDIIRFYPNDYCGPCVGGYGSGLKREAAA